MIKVRFSFGWQKSGCRVSLDKVYSLPTVVSLTIQISSFNSSEGKRHLFNLLQACCNLQSLIIIDWDGTLERFVHIQLSNNLLNLHLDSTNISHHELKTFLKSQPKLRSIKLDMRYNVPFDTELSELLSKIVSNPRTMLDEDQLPFKKTRFNFFNSPEENSSSAIKNHINDRCGVDADTSLDLNKTFNLNRIFYNHRTGNHPKPGSYRLNVYDTVTFSLSGEDKPPFTLSNSQSMQLSHDPDIKLIDNIYQHSFQLPFPSRYGKQSLELDSSWQGIASLTPHDRLYGIEITPPISVEIQYSHRDNLYYIRCQQAQSTDVTIEFIIYPNHPQSRPQLPQFITNSINEFRKFGDKALVIEGKTLSGADYINEIMKQKVGACRHRAVAFLTVMSLRYPNYPMRIIANDCHMFVEIKIDGYWHTCDLGGYPAQVNINDLPRIIPKSPQQLQFEADFKTWNAPQKPKSPSMALYLDTLLTNQQNTHLIHLPKIQSTALVMDMIRLSNLYSYHIIYIHSYDDLVSSNITVTAQGLKPLVMINFNQFTDEDIVNTHGFVDTMRDAIKIIGLIDPLKPNIYQGADFYSRFQDISSLPAQLTPLSSSLLPWDPSTPKPEGITINLSFETTWQRQLLGGPVFKQSQLSFEPGELIHALNQKKPILIQNPPQDELFDLFWQRARFEGTIQDGNHGLIALPESLMLYTFERYDWEQSIAQITWSDSISPEMHILNPGTLNQFLVDYQIDAQGKLSTDLNIFAKHTLLSPGQPLPVFLTRSLSDNQWDVFFKEHQKYPQLKLNIACAQGVTLPEALINTMYISLSQLINTQIIHADDRDLAIAQLTSNTLEPWIIFDISESTSFDLLERMEITIIDSQFNFKKTELALTLALREKQNIILTGEFSNELLDGLATFLLSRTIASQALGQLILVSEKPLMYLESIRLFADWPQKQALLLKAVDNSILSNLRPAPTSCSRDCPRDPKILLDAHKNCTETERTGSRGQAAGRRDLNCQQTLKSIATQQELDLLLPEHKKEPLINIITRLRHQKQYPNTPTDLEWVGLKQTIPIPQQKIPFQYENTALITQQVISERLLAVEQGLKNSPFIFLTGLTGVGKSSFVEQELKNKYRLFHGESTANIEAWANAHDAEQLLVLFLDEANLSAKSWCEIEGLFQDPPTILINGKCHQLSPRHKIIFAGNPLSYGDERKLAPLFLRHGGSVVFQPLCSAFVYETSIKPIIDFGLPESARRDVAIELCRVYDNIIQLSRHEVLISPRQIQMIALQIIHDHARYPQANILDIAKYHAHRAAIDATPLYLTSFGQDQTLITSRAALLKDCVVNKPKLTQHMVTPSRVPLINELNDFLMLRQYQRELPATAHPSLRFGGLNRFIIEGNPGLGKTELVVELAKMLGLTLIEILPNMPLKTQKQMLLDAFDQGSIVFINEINSMPMLEQELNSLLDGKHPLDNLRAPHQPGFRLIGTQNPASMAGRRLASPALNNRSIIRQVLEYTQDEIEGILENKGIPNPTCRNLAQAYLEMVKEAKEKHLSPAPSFRHLILKAEKILDQQLDDFLDKQLMDIVNE